MTATIGSQWLRIRFKASLERDPAVQGSPIGSRKREYQFCGRRRRGETDDDLAARMLQSKGRGTIGRLPLSCIQVTPWV